MTVYAERVFALNAGLNFLLLLGSARLAGAPALMRRVLPAAALGGVYAVAALVPALGFLQTAGMKAVAAALMLLLAFGAERRTVSYTHLTEASAPTGRFAFSPNIMQICDCVLPGRCDARRLVSRRSRA